MLNFLFSYTSIRSILRDFRNKNPILKVSVLGVDIVDIYFIKIFRELNDYRKNLLANVFLPIRLQTVMSFRWIRSNDSKLSDILYFLETILKKILLNWKKALTMLRWQYLAINYTTLASISCKSFSTSNSPGNFSDSLQSFFFASRKNSLFLNVAWEFLKRFSIHQKNIRKLQYS